MPATLISIAAMAKNRVIGKDGKLPWHLPEDLRFFKQTTTGHPILMGRKTWQSLGRPLPNRRNLVLSRTLSAPEGTEVLRDPRELEERVPEGELYIIGGAEIYQLLLPRTDVVLLTVLPEDWEGDTWFPEFEDQFSRPELIHEIPGKAKWLRFERLR